jgi:hypothetical protein
MNTAEGLDEQSPNYIRRRWPECSCTALAHGGCRCEDDGSVNGRVEYEALEHEPGGYPRRVRNAERPLAEPSQGTSSVVAFHSAPRHYLG